LPVPPLLVRALAAAIVVQLSVAGVVVAAGGPGTHLASAGVERAEILATAVVAERDVLATSGIGDPVPLEAPAPAPSAPPATEPPPPPPSAQPRTSGGPRDAACEKSMLQWMNEARAGAGAATLVDDAVVDHVAHDWSTHLAASGQLAHNPRYADQVFAARPQAMTAGEVVGRGHDARAIFDEFLRSPTHRDAILRRAFTHGTVGCGRDAGGQAWVTANFWG
jgi:uncharacterized protein YkwD